MSSTAKRAMTSCLSGCAPPRREAHWSGHSVGYWHLAHTAFREGDVAAENALGHDTVVANRGVPRPI
jgi:hypothetical protein